MGKSPTYHNRIGHALRSSESGKEAYKEMLADSTKGLG